MALVYTPGVAEPAKAIAADVSLAYDYTIKGHTVAVVTDGSAVLGLGDIGPEAAMPIMEGKCELFKTFADLDAFPIALATKDKGEIIRTVKAIAPGFGAVNLEDISAPRCFEIEAALQDIGIPVMHDDQHGTAIVLLAGLLNAVKLADKKLSELRIVMVGAGAAGNGIQRLIGPLVGDIVLVDSHGIVSGDRNDLDDFKRDLAGRTNSTGMSGTLSDAMAGADVFVGVSRGGLVNEEMVRSMAKAPMIFAMANPEPEIMPDAAKAAGAFIVATGRSDMPNQVNNSLAFPGVFKGALAARATRITEAMKLAAAHALADVVKQPSVDKIIPGPFDDGVCEAVADAVARAA